MTFFEPFRGRWMALWSILLAQLLAGALLGALGTAALARPLMAHPDGVWTLFAEGGRIALDLYRLHHEAIELAVLVGAVGVVAWACVWLLLGGALPTLFTPRAPSLRECVAHSIRRAPTLLGLATFFALGLAFAAAVGVMGELWVGRRTMHSHDAHHRDLLRLAMLLPPMVIFAVTSVWHDIARSRAFAKGLRAPRAAAESVAELARSPWRYLSRAAGFALLGQAAVGVSALCAMVLEHNRATWAVAALFVAQQLALAWRFACRARWFAWLSESP